MTDENEVTKCAMKYPSEFAGKYPPEFVSNLEDPDQNNIKLWREFRGFSQAELAEKTALSVPRLNLIEQYDWHKIHRMPIGGLQLLAIALSCNIDDLLDWSDVDNKAVLPRRA